MASAVSYKDGEEVECKYEDGHYYRAVCVSHFLCFYVFCVVFMRFVVLFDVCNILGQ